MYDLKYKGGISSQMVTLEVLGL